MSKEYNKANYAYSGLYQSWKAAVLGGDWNAQRRTAEAHSRMIERVNGPHDPWFYRPRESQT